MKIDTHQHFWDLQKLDYPWMNPEQKVIYRNFYPSDLQSELEANGVDGTVTVQATHSEAETEWLLSLARSNSFIKGVVGWLDLTAPDLSERLEKMLALGPLRGVRHQVHDEPDTEWLLQPAVVNGLRTLAKRDIPYDLLLRPPHLKVLPALFEAVPDATWIIDHIAKPEIKAGIMEPWAEDIRRASAYPNVYCKVSGIITEADWANWSAAQIRPYFEVVLESFGPERLLFGSDWPVCLLAGSYSRVIQLVEELIASLSEGEKNKIWFENALRVYKL
ncbi:MAG TPA: amidohydrolase family protein [Chloroflexia bacterium]|nr:amidohydrolase family protein [Chloroflexia bacterium]